MKILVLGHSASAGDGLPKRELAWPWLLREQLTRDLGTAVELEHVSVVPMGPKAVSYATTRARAASPDIVVLCVGSYICAIGTVSEQVKHLFGERVHRRYLRWERRFDARTRNASGASGKANRAGRSLFRRLIGTRTYASVEEVSRVYSEILHGLAQMEGVQVIVFSDPDWPEWVNRSNRGAQRALEELRRVVTEVARLHHFPFVSAQTTYGSGSERDALLYQADGVHKSEEGHRVQAAALSDALRSVAEGIKETA